MTMSRPTRTDSVHGRLQARHWRRLRPWDCAFAPRRRRNRHEVGSFARVRIRPSSLALACLSLLSACGLLRTAAETPSRLTSAVFGSGAQSVDPRLVQQRLMRFADLFALEVTNATHEFSVRSGTTEGRIQALTWKLDYTGAMWRLASGPKPFAGLFDAIVLVTGVRFAHENRWKEHWGEADLPMAESLARLEQAVWDLAGEALREEQLAEVRSIVAQWMSGDPASRVTDASRMPGFVDLADPARKDGKSGVMSELTSLVSVDPLAGLEPAVREVEETRQFAERGLYYLQRMPELLSARVELLVLRSSQSPEMLGTLASLQRVSEAATSIAATAQALPASVSAEREAAIKQIAEELTAQRAGLVHDLEQAREPVVELLDSTRRTAESGQAMSVALTDTLRVLDAFVGRFAAKEPEPGTVPSAPEPAQGESAAKPFDIVEYGVAAERLGTAAAELGTAIATLDRSLPQVQRVLEAAAERGERSVDHLFLRACELLGLALVGAALTMLVVRRLSRR